MRLVAVKAGDIVEGDVRGQRFFARVAQVHRDRAETRLEITPLNGKPLGYALLTARQVVGIYRKASGSR